MVLGGPLFSLLLVVAAYILFLQQSNKSSAFQPPQQLMLLTYFPHLLLIVAVYYLLASLGTANQRNDLGIVRAALRNNDFDSLTGLNRVTTQWTIGYRPRDWDSRALERACTVLKDRDHLALALHMRSLFEWDCGRPQNSLDLVEKAWQIQGNNKEDTATSLTFLRAFVANDLAGATEVWGHVQDKRAYTALLASAALEILNGNFDQSLRDCDDAKQELLTKHKTITPNIQAELEDIETIRQRALSSRPS